MDLVLFFSIFCFLIIAIFRIDLAVLFIVSLLPTYLIRFNVLGIPFTFLEIMILVSFASWFIQVTKLKPVSWFKDYKKRQPYPFYREIIIITLVAFLGVAAANFSLTSLGLLKAYFLEPILLFILIINISATKASRQKLLLGLLFGALTTAMLAIFQQITGTFIINAYWANLDTRRVVSWFGYPNAVGLFLGPITVIMLSWLLELLKKPKSLLLKITILFTILSSFLAIYFAKSEGAMLGLLVSMFLCLLIIKKTRLLSLIIMAVSLIIIFTTHSLRNYALEKITLQDLSGEIRKQQWAETAKTINTKSLFLGNGLGGYQRAVEPYHQEGIFFNRDKILNFNSILYDSAELRDKYWQPVEIYLYPHNIFLNFWTELGIFGLLVFSWLIIKSIFISLKLFLKNKDYLALGLAGSMIAIITHGLVDVPYFKNDLSALFFIILAILSLLIIDSKAVKLNNSETK